MITAAQNEMQSLADKLAGEVVLAEPGTEHDLLTVIHLFTLLEESSSAHPAPEPLPSSIHQAHDWLNELLASTGSFTPDALKKLENWTAWMQEALAAWKSQSALPGLPADWSGEQKAAGPAIPPVVAEDCTDGRPAVLNIEQDGELLREFINESLEHLQNIEQGVLVLEENPSNLETLNSIFRAFHTVKGGAGFLNLNAIQRLAHELESLLDLARQNRLDITRPVISLILEAGDTLKESIAGIDAQLTGAKPPQQKSVPPSELIKRVRVFLSLPQAPTSKPVEAPAPALIRDPEPDFTPAPIVAAAPAPTPTPLPSPQPTLAAAPLQVQPDVQQSLPAKETPAKEAARPENGEGSKTADIGSAVKVDTAKLDGLVDLVGELVISQSLVLQNPDLISVQSQQLNRDLAQLGRIIKDLQRTAMSLRMVPIKSAFLKMNRLVRDVTGKVGKRVQLLMEGEDTELDRTIVEELSDPLIHMIRNSVDHGIEKPDVRSERGKPAQGTIWLKAFYQGGNFVMQIKDDGNGLDKVRIRAKAVEKGLIRADEDLPDSQIFNLIFAAGFSTADKVTDLSGRGVGLDVVRRNIERLRGKIDIESTPGAGSCFTISLPLTLAIIDGLIVGVGEHRYILPTLSVCESLRPTADMISTIYEHGEMVSVRGRLHPLLRLYEHLGVKPASADPTQSIVVVVQAGSQVRCVLVDQLLGKQEVVIKSLGESFRNARCLAGAAILGDGRVGLILDPEGLVNLQSTPSRKKAA